MPRPRFFCCRALLIASHLSGLLFSVGYSQSAPQPDTDVVTTTDDPDLQRTESALDWVGVERLSRQKLLDLDATGRQRSAQAGADNNWLGKALFNEGRYAEAEPMFQRAIAIWEQALGPQHPDLARALGNLAVLYNKEAEYAKAEPLDERAIAILEKAPPAQQERLGTALNNLATVYLQEGEYAQAENLYRRALSISNKTAGPGPHQPQAAALNNMAFLYLAEGRPAKAEELFQSAVEIREKANGAGDPGLAASLIGMAGLDVRAGQYAKAESLAQRALAIREKALGPEHSDVAQSLSALASLYETEGRHALAEPLYQRALSIEEKSFGPDHPDVAGILNPLALLYEKEGDPAKAEPLLNRALAIRRKALGPEHRLVAQSLNNLAFLYGKRGEYAKAEPLLQQVLAIDEKALGPEHPGLALFLDNLAFAYDKEGQPAKAEPLFLRALVIREKAFGPSDPLTAEVRQQLGGFYLEQGRFDVATANLRLACGARSSALRSGPEYDELLTVARSQASTCAGLYSLSLHGWAAQGGGGTSTDTPDALAREAFLAAQRAMQSVAGNALARSAARMAATKEGVGEAAEAYETVLRDRNQLNDQFALIAGDPRPEKAALRVTLLQARNAASTKLETLSASLRKSDARYWDYRSPEPLDVATLQAASGRDSLLLHANEALLVIESPTVTGKGLVFAVSRERFAWAEIPIEGDVLTRKVRRLRAQIDPQGYGVRGFLQTQKIGTESGQPTGGGFDRQTAYDLYRALLGDPAIQAVIKDKSDLLFVPSGALTSLPPALLVTEQPPGGPPQDADPEALRSTAWLLRSKAVALLPAVSSLRTLRQILPDIRDQSRDPLLAFADPTYSRGASAGSSPAPTRGAVVRSVRAYYRGAVPMQEALADLPRLPGTRAEAEALRIALGADAGSLLTGADASKSQLMARNADGRLARVRVLEFATHALVAGDVSDLAEPALVLAAGANPSDELLSASEAATLNLHADWVLLSACNTASPESADAQGLSGLARAFFFAGAHSLLVSHWRVRDDVAERLIPPILLAERADPTLTHAQALRRASLAILDDPTLNAANPSAWAPFTLIGEPGR